jgi:hypothetical protein
VESRASGKRNNQMSGKKSHFGMTSAGQAAAGPLPLMDCGEGFVVRLAILSQLPDLGPTIIDDLPGGCLRSPSPAGRLHAEAARTPFWTRGGS